MPKNPNLNAIEPESSFDIKAVTKTKNNFKLFGSLISFLIVFFFFGMESILDGSGFWLTYSIVLGAVLSPIGYWMGVGICWCMPSQRQFRKVHAR